MAGFGDALRKGLDAHRRADDAEKEMNEVLDAASTDVTSVMQAPISFRFGAVSSQSLASATSDVRIGEVLFGEVPSGEKRNTLAAQLADRGWVFLAEVTFGELGYPVTLRWEHMYDTATDRASFEEVIKTLLAHSATGAKIARLLGRKDMLTRFRCDWAPPKGSTPKRESSCSEGRVLCATPRPLRTSGTSAL